MRIVVGLALVLVLGCPLFATAKIQQETDRFTGVTTIAAHQKLGRPDRHVFLAKAKGRTAARRKAAIAADQAFGFTHLLVDGEVDAQNAFGAKLRSSFECEVTRTKDDRYMVMSARISSR